MRKIAFWLSVALIFTMPWETAIEYAALGTVSRIIGLLLFAVWALSVLLTRKIRKPHPFHYLFFLLVMWHISSFFWSIDPDKTLDRLETYVQLFALVYIIWDLYTTPQSITIGLQAYVLGAWVSVGNMIYNYINDIRFSNIRFSAFDFDKNNIGVILAIGIPIAWYLGVLESQKKNGLFLKIANILYIPAALFAILLTGSRGALLATAPALIYILITLGRLKLHYRILVVVFLGASFITILPMVPQALIERLSTTESSIAEGDLSGRVNIWKAGFETLSEHPFLGIGSSAFTSATDLNKQAHNSYLSVLFELGIVGFSIASIIFLVIAYHSLVHPPRIRLFWTTVLLVLAIGIFSLNWSHRKQTWLFPIMTIASACVPAQQPEKKRLTRSKIQVNSKMPAFQPKNAGLDITS